MKFNETIEKFTEELIRPNKEIFWDFSRDYAYVWMVIMKKDHLLLVVDGPPLKDNKKPDESIFKKAIDFTKRTAMNAVKSLKKRLTEEEEEEGAHGMPHGVNIVAKLQIPFEIGSDGKLSYGDVVETKKIAKEIIEDSKFLYDRFGVVSLDNEDFIKYGITKKSDYDTEV